MTSVAVLSLSSFPWPFAVELCHSLIWLNVSLQWRSTDAVFDLLYLPVPIHVPIPGILLKPVHLLSPPCLSSTLPSLANITTKGTWWPAVLTWTFVLRNLDFRRTPPGTPVFSTIWTPCNIKPFWPLLFDWDPMGNSNTGKNSYSLVSSSLWESIRELEMPSTKKMPFVYLQFLPLHLY